MIKKLFVLVLCTFVASTLAVLIAGPTQQAGAQEGDETGRAGCANPGLYTGRSTTGNFQDALEDAVDKAEACAGCCDFIVSYGFVEANGERGGLLFRNNLDVTIKAQW